MQNIYNVILIGAVFVGYIHVIWSNQCVTNLRSIVTKMPKSYVLFDNFASRFQYIMSALCDTIPEHVVEDNLVNSG